MHFSRCFVELFAPGKELNILSSVFFIWRNVPYSTVAMLGVVPLNEVVDPYPGITHIVEPISGPLRAILQRFEQRF